MNTRAKMVCDEGTKVRLIATLTDEAVEGINEEEAESWIRIGGRVHSYVEAMKAQFGDIRDWYVELAEHRASVHKSTMLRNYAGAWRIWQEFSEEARGNLKGIGISHLALVLSPRYTQEDREIHLKHAADQGLSVSEFKAYLKEKGKGGSVTDAAASTVTQSMDDGTTAQTAQSTQDSEDAASTDWSRTVSDIQSSLNKTYSHLVGLNSLCGGREIPQAIVLAVGNIVRFAITQGMISGKDIHDLTAIKPIPVGYVSGTGNQDLAISKQGGNHHG